MSTADIFRTLGDPTRLAILERLAKREMTVSDLTAQFDISQPAISQQLLTLRSNGLVSQRRDGRHIYYRAEPAGMKPIIDWLGHYRAFWQQKLPRLKTLLKDMKHE